MFYEKFVAMCAKKNKSPTAVAVELGISRASVTGWKKGAKPRDFYIWMIANYFDVPPDFFYDEYQDQSTEKYSNNICKDEKEQSPVSEGLSAAKQDMYDFIDTLSDEQVQRLLQIARAAFDR